MAHPGQDAAGPVGGMMNLQIPATTTKTPTALVRVMYEILDAPQAVSVWRVHEMKNLTDAVRAFAIR